MKKNIRRSWEEKELQLAQGCIKTKEEYEAAGAAFMGSLGQAAKANYLTPAACQRRGRPVTAEEMENIRHFAVFANCYTDLCIVVNGQRKRPCLPVFFREEDPK